MSTSTQDGEAAPEAPGADGAKGPAVLRVAATLERLGLKLPLGVPAIERLLPHRPPFLLIDRIVSCDDVRCVALKGVTLNEPFFAGHFPGHPVMPGVLILEALAQAAGAHSTLVLGSDAKDFVIYLMAFEKAKFRRPVVPGDRLELHTEVLRGRGRIWKYRGEAKVDGAVVAEAEFMATVEVRGGAPA